MSPLDDRRHHHRSPAPAVEDDGIGEGPAGRTPRIFEQVQRLMDVQLGEAHEHRLLRRRELVDPGQPRGLDHRSQGVGDFGRGVCPALQEREVRTERAQGLRRGAQLHDLGHDLFE